MSRTSDPGDQPELRAAAGYPLGQLQRALENAVRSDDPEIRRRAGERALLWEQVLSGISSGTLRIGSRTPVEGAPAWVTLEVAPGGFATGRYAAEGPLEAWEQELLAALPGGFGPDRSPRHRLNTWYLTDPGLAELQHALAARTYEVDVPEAGALLVVAWLAARGRYSSALDLVAELYPFIDRLRFYPRPAEGVAAATGAVVHLRPATDVAAQLRQQPVPDQVAAMVGTLTVWHPLFDRLVALWLETVDGGWPCRRWPDSWATDRLAWLADHQAAAERHPPGGRHTRPRSSYAILRDALERCPHDSSTLSPRDVGRVRAVLARSVDRWGAPGSERHTALRSAQAGWAARPTHQAIAAVVADRLLEHAVGPGVPDFDPVLAPVTFDPDVEVEVPASLAHKAERAREAPVAELVERGVIGSAEVLAEVVPQISGQVVAAAIDDPDLRAPYDAVYRAFRRRRGLLLVDYQHQVRIGELPWMGALDPFRSPDPSARLTARATLTETAQLAITSFPHALVPNPLVRELAALAGPAGFDLPFVEEVAADIFMGSFTDKWREAARVAAEALSGTLYARYYDLPPASTWARRPRRPARVLLADGFAARCRERAREAAAGDGGSVARNGAVIEQSQILTTHNLAPLVHGLGLADRLAAVVPHLVPQVFDWIVREQTRAPHDRRAALHTIKNTAYAWRQALFLLSLAEEPVRQQVVGRLRDRWAAGPDPWRTTFEPALVGLEHVHAGGRFDPTGRTDGGRRFLGWSVGPHWMLPPPTPAQADRWQR